MAVLTINKAVLPDGFTLTVQAGGNLAASTIYHYRVAAVNADGECCACASKNETTTITDKTIKLDWNAVPGVKATGGYIVYRNTADSWDSGNLKLATVNTNSYTDDGSATPSAGVPASFTADVDMVGPSFLTGPAAAREESNIVDKHPPGKEGSILDYQGGPSDRLVLTGVLKGSTAKTQLDKLRAFRRSGIPYYIVIAAHTVTWIDDTYMIASLPWSLAIGAPSDAGAAWVNYVLELMQYVA